MVNWNIIYAHSWPDPLYEDMVHYLRHGEYPRVLPQHIKRTFQKRVRSGYTLENNDLVLRVSSPPWIVNRNNNQAIVFGRGGEFVFRVVKASRREALLRDLMSQMTKVSTNAHMFVDRVHREGYLGVSRRFIHSFLQTHSSTVAKRIVTANTRKETVKSFRPEYPFQHWQIDTMDMIQFAKQNRGYRHILVIIDIFTKFVYIHPLRNKSQFDIAQVLKKIFLSGDIPDKLHSDNGTEFKGSGGAQNHVGRLCIEYKVRQIFGDTYSPQTQGFVENKNKQIKTLLNYFRINNNSYNYVDILDEVAYTINNSKHAVTGYTPMELHKGRQVEKSYSILASDQQETEGEFIDEPTDAELENYYHRSNALYDERVNHVKNTIKGVARKREQRQKNQTELRNGSYVYVLSYVTHSSEIQGVFIRVGENTHAPNPLRLRSIAKQPRTLFSEFELKGPKKYYKFVFQITGIVKDRHAVTRYHLSTAPEMSKQLRSAVEPVFLKVDSAGVYKREFNRNHLVLFDPTRTGMPNKTKQIRPNDLYIDLTLKRSTNSGCVEKMRYGEFGVSRVNIPGDGDCMFTAAIEGLKRLDRLPLPNGGIRNHKDLRREVVAAVHAECVNSKNKNTFVQLLNASNQQPTTAGFADCDAYRAHMGRDGSWGGDVELSKIRSILAQNRINLEIYVRVGENLVLHANSLPGGFDTSVRLLYNGMHYDTLLFEKEQPKNNNNRRTCSIQSLLKKLKKNKPFIFLVIPDPEYGSDPGPELAVFKVQLQRYDANQQRWVYEEEKDRNNPNSNIEYDSFYVDLTPDMYNKMGSENGWRFVDHNRLLLRTNNCETEVDGHFASDADDTPLVDYRGKLIDPSYDVRTMLNTGRQRPGIRYAFNSYDDGKPLGIPTVRTGNITKRKGQKDQNRFEIQWENNTVTEVELDPSKYGRLLDEIDGWEFVNFNEVFNIKLNQDLKKKK